MNEGQAMIRMLRKSKQGFTLIELMIVVAIIGILAVLAIYGVRKYLANAKTAEARNSLGQMGKDETSAFEKESMLGTALAPGATAGLSRSLCVTPSSPVPATAGSIKGQKYQSSQAAGADWNKDAATAGKGFACLKFAMDAPQYYMYTFTTAAPGNVAGNTWVATAQGDLNGDGNLSTFTMNGLIQPSMTFSLAPNLVELNPEE
jgi:type IV pilus assembly protein PilA